MDNEYSILWQPIDINGCRIRNRISMSGMGTFTPTMGDQIETESGLRYYEERAKGGIINFTRQAAAEWALKGVTCNALCPGFFASEANTPEAMENMNGFITARTPMQRPGEPGELDSSIIYLAAHESSYVTGSIITCDGGWTAV